MREDITSFCPDSDCNYPFIIEMAGISYCDGSYRIRRKKSPVYVFEYVLGGQGVVRTGACEFQPVAGDIYILHRGSSHEYFSDPVNPWTKIWFNAKGALIDSLVEVYGLDGVNHVRGLDLGEDFQRMLSTAQTKDMDMKIVFGRCSLIFHEIILAISSHLDSVSNAADNEALKLKKYMDSHLKEKVTVSDLSAVIYRSVSQTIRIFRKEYGCTPYNYLVGKRIKMAAMLLENSNMSIREISDQLGFADQHYFCNCFKNKTGMAPKVYRKH